MHGPTHLLTTFRRWPAASQQGARRNAMVASTELAQRRAEREEVAEFLARLGRAPQQPAPALRDSVRAAHG